MNSNCSLVCLYVSSPLTESAPYLVHPNPGEFNPTFYSFGYSEGVNYSNPANAVPNSLYGVYGPHPSDVVLGFDTQMGVNGENVYVDTLLPLKYPTIPPEPNGTVSPPPASPPAPPAAYAKSLNAGVHVPTAITLAEQSPLWAWSTCHWIADCSSSQVVGSPCSATLSGVTWNGFCFESSAGTLECGRASAFDNQQGTNTMVVGTGPHEIHQGINQLPVSTRPPSPPGASVSVLDMVPMRCERGAAAIGGGAYVQKRLLIAGCMITSDALYSAMAEVHVPEYCATPANYMMGCMFPDAYNYDATAKQPTNCRYRTYGCTDQTKINFNPEAVVDDGSCFSTTRVPGCTVAPVSYQGVAATTPGYKSLSVGSARTGEGMVNEAAYTWQVVTNHNSAANALMGCQIAIEGCMDSSATNYDSRATVNSNSWCIPPVSGCMMPMAAYGAPSYVPQTSAGQMIRIDGFAANYNPAASVHAKSACVIERHGCMDSTARNYDARATVPGDCYKATTDPLNSGCMNPQARNFGCTTTGQTPCVTATVCGPTSLDCAPVVQDHQRALCTWGPAPPNPPGPPVATAQGEVVVEIQIVEVVLVAAGSVSDYTPTIIDNLKAVFARGAGVDASKVTIIIIAGSVIITSQIEFDTAAAATAAVAQVQATIGTDAASASAALGISVQSVPEIAAKSIMVARPEVRPDVPIGIIVGPAGGGAALLILVIVAGFYLSWRKKNRKVDDFVESAEIDYTDQPVKRQAWSADDD